MKDDDLVDKVFKSCVLLVTHTQFAPEKFSPFANPNVVKEVFYSVAQISCKF